MPYTIIENCGICGKPHECVAVNGDDIAKGIEGGCTGVVCDELPKKGCLKHFCKGCIRHHKCSNDYGRKK
jgi:hypothetical protein